MKFLFILLFCTSVHAGFKREGNEILPFSEKNYPLKSFIQDYAEIMNVNITYPENLFRKETMVHVNFNTRIGQAEFEKIFYSILDMTGFTAIKEGEMMWLYHSRDIRYLPVNLYTDDTYPRNRSYSTVAVRLNNPLSSNIARNLRPILSRYGRVIDFSDGYTLIISDVGTNIERIVKTISSMDTKDAFANMVADKPAPKEEDNPLRDKLVDLQLENDILKKKLTEMKEKQ